MIEVSVISGGTEVVAEGVTSLGDVASPGVGSLLSEEGSFTQADRKRSIRMRKIEFTL
jgi:hypothetical protein